MKLNVFLYMALAFFAVSTPVSAQNNNAATVIDEIIVTGKIKAGDDAMAAFFSGDYATAEIEFEKNLRTLIRIENLNTNAFLQTQNDQINATIRNGPPQAGAQGGIQQNISPTALNLSSLGQFNKRDAEDVITSGADKGFQLYMMGLSQIQLEKFDDAKVSFTRALRLNKSLHDARARLGLIYLSERSFEASRKQLLKLDKARKRCGESCRNKEKIEAATLILARELAKG